MRGAAVLITSRYSMYYVHVRPSIAPLSDLFEILLFKLIHFHENGNFKETVSPDNASLLGSMK